MSKKHRLGALLWGDPVLCRYYPTLKGISCLFASCVPRNDVSNCELLQTLDKGCD